MDYTRNEHGPWRDDVELPGTGSRIGGNNRATGAVSDDAKKRETLDRLSKSALTPPTTSLFTWAGYYNSRSSVHHCAAGNHTLGCFVEIFVCLLRGKAARLATRRALFSF